jgi:hypothetical protein
MTDVRSKDGTMVACERSGNSPALLLVDGARCSRAPAQHGELAGQTHNVKRDVLTPAVVQFFTASAAAASSSRS